MKIWEEQVMGLWDKANELREFEGKDSKNAEYTSMQRRVLKEGGIGKRKSALALVMGLFFALSLTGFEFALKHPEVEGLLQRLFWFGLIFSIIGVLLIPFGIYQFIKSFSFGKTLDKKDE